jgi:hypothetical protein
LEKEKNSVKINSEDENVLILPEAEEKIKTNSEESTEEQEEQEGPIEILPSVKT